MTETPADYAWLHRCQGCPPLVVAHRGASGLAPENTLAAFRLALAIGAPAVECDVHLSADRVPVVIHDATLDRTTDGHGLVEAHALDQLKTLDAGRWRDAAFAGERIPTLDEVLELCAGKARVFVELKAGGGVPLIEAALAAIDRHPETDIAVISFDVDIVAGVHQRRPATPLGLLVSAQRVAKHGEAAVILATTDSGAGFLAPHYAAITAALATAARQAGLAIGAWTVDEPQTMHRLAHLGVDAITTNHPEVALAALSTGALPARMRSDQAREQSTYHENRQS